MFDTSPNPAWYYLEIDQPGNLLIDITNNLGMFQDIDLQFGVLFQI
ncbi:MAG: hypothetical protein CM15mP65_30040 [Crocinitomicaceae bacterium]|nr:MAG: hypothetical protein CM15mP65_30040 [Crocinitomicaceae bacterium]